MSALDSAGAFFKTVFQVFYPYLSMGLIILALVWGLEKGGLILGVLSGGGATFVLVYPVIHIRLSIERKGPQGHGETFDDHKFPSATEQQALMEALKKGDTLKGKAPKV